MSDQKNLILAIVVSVLILVGFQHFVLGPREQARREALQQAQPAAEQTTGTTPAGTPAAPGTAPTPTAGELQSLALSRPEALARGPRVRIDTPRLHGSLSLTGARLDDLSLADYHETVDPHSPEITLLSPRHGPSPYYVDFGWTAAEGSGVATPGPDTVWTADHEVLTADQPVTLSWDNGAGVRFERIIAIDRNYMFTITQRVSNQTEAPIQLAAYARVLRFGTPHTLGYYILHEGPYGVFGGTLHEYNYGNVRDDGTIAHETTGGWLGFTDKYWLVAVIPDQNAPVTARFIHRTESGESRFFATYTGEPVTVPPGGTTEAAGRVFAGAKEVALIDGYASNLGIQHFDLAIDFGWFYFLTKPFFYVLTWIHGLVGNFGIAILIFTVLIKAVFFPLANKSYTSMSKMKALQPEMVKLRERFADDRQRMNMELMALYKREKVNPAAGCLPILIQIPVFFALYKVLFVTIEMRHAPFFGWIHDLSEVDPTTIFNLFGLIPWQPPGFLMIGAWPIIMGITMWLQQKLNPAPTDPVQQKVFMALPVIFTFMLAHFPSGLVIYWAWNNTLSMAQQWLIMRRMHVKVSGGVDRPAAAAPSILRKRGRDDAEPVAETGDDPAAADPRADAAVRARSAPTVARPASRRRSASSPRRKG